MELFLAVAVVTLRLPSSEEVGLLLNEVWYNSTGGVGEGTVTAHASVWSDGRRSNF